MKLKTQTKSQRGFFKLSLLFLMSLFGGFVACGIKGRPLPPLQLSPSEAPLPADSPSDPSSLPSTKEKNQEKEKKTKESS